MQQGIGFDDPGNPFHPSLLLMNLFFKSGGRCSTLVMVNNSKVCRYLLMVSGSPSPYLTSSHHQEGGAGLSPGSPHPEHAKKRWAQGCYLLLSLHFPAIEDFQNSLSLNQYHKCLSSQGRYIFLMYLPVSQHHNDGIPCNLFFM